MSLTKSTMNRSSLSLALCTLLAATSPMLADELGTAFGVTIGKPLPDNASVSRNETNGVIATSFLQPTNSVKYLQRFMVVRLVTEETNVVVSLTGRGAFGEKSERDEAFDVLKEVITKKYKTDSARTAETLNRFTIWQGTKVAELSKDMDIKQFPSSYIVTLQYSDETLAELAVKAQKARKVQETPTDGL